MVRLSKKWLSNNFSSYQTKHEIRLFWPTLIYIYNVNSFSLIRASLYPQKSICMSMLCRVRGYYKSITVTMSQSLKPILPEYVMHIVAISWS